MFLENDLKQLGIEVTEKLSDQAIINISGQVATKLTATFSNCNLNYLEIYRKLLETPMFYAKIPDEMSDVNYFYKNSTIYFSTKVDLKMVDEYMFHECIHKIQEHRDKKGNLTRMGLCEINEIKVNGTALNEAAIQYITAKSLNCEKKLVTIYDITLPVNTGYYPIITNLIAQIAYLIGEDVLVDSTINSNENFKFEFIDTCGESTFNQVQENFDRILQSKNNILNLQKDGLPENDEKIAKNIENIKDLYIETQNLIFTSYFDNLLKRVDTVSETEKYRKKLYSYRAKIGTVLEYDFFNSYCLEQDKKSRAKAEKIRENSSLALVKDSKISRFFRNLKKLFINSINEYNK